MTWAARQHGTLPLSLPFSLQLGKQPLLNKCSSAQHTKRDPHVCTSEGGWMKYTKEADQGTVEVVAMIPVYGPQERSPQLRAPGSSKGAKHTTRASWPQRDHAVQSVQLLSHVRLFATSWTAALQASQSITNSQSPPKPMSIELVIPFNHLILCRPLLLLPSIFPNIRVFASESALRIRWPKYSSFSFNISLSNEHPGLISFRMDWLDVLAVQGTLESLLQHHSSKASILWHSAFFIAQSL